MQKVHVEKQQIFGMSDITKNSLEMKPETSKIMPCWESFMSKYSPEILKGEVFGVYTNYKSDENGEYLFVAGSNDKSLEEDNLTSVEIKTGEYRKFVFEGPIPQCVIDGWQQIWEFYSENEYSRAFTTDFELYTEKGVDIYIAEL